MIRTYARLSLTLDDTWRVGSWQGSAASVRGAARDPMAPTSPYVPGSSVLGSLKAGLGDRLAKRLFGPLTLSGASTPKNDKERRERSSAWWVLGTQLGESTIGSRQQTAISRYRRAPAAHGLSRAEEATATTLAVYLRCDADDVTKAAPLIDGLVAAVQEWRPRIGGGRTTGLGFAKVTSLTHRSFDLGKLDDVLALAGTAGAGAGKVEALLKSGATTVTVEPRVHSRHVVAMTVPAIGLLEEAQGIRATHGSQWKGMLRSRVEYIARSMGHPRCLGDDPDPNEPDRKHLWTGCGRCDICEAFGSSVKAGAWEFHTTGWTSPTGAPESLQTRNRTRNAIDRFTSGVRDKATFPDYSVSDVTLELAISEQREAPEWATIALYHALRDLNDGLWGIGPRSATGLGTVAITSVKRETPDVRDASGVETTTIDLDHLAAVEPRVPETPVPSEESA